MSSRKLLLTACVVVRNEEAVIGRCLDSLAGLADELIVIHDGPAADRTLEIARTYGAEIITAAYSGFMEAHLPEALTRAQGEWILRIDADEFLSPELRAALPELLAEEADAYEFLWPLYDGQRYLTKTWPYKRALFRRDKVSFVGLIHFLPEINGRVERVSYRLEHRPAYNNFSWSAFRTKWLPWATLYAQQLAGEWNKLPTFNSRRRNWPFLFRLRRNLNILLAPLDFIITFLKTLFGTGFKGMIAWKVAFLQGMWRGAVDVFLCFERLKSRPGLKKSFRRVREELRLIVGVLNFNIFWSLRKNRAYNDINAFEQKIFSQHGEDGLLKLIFERIGVTNRFFVEFGVEDGRECNTRYLREVAGWRGLWMDGGKNLPDPIKHEWITAENIQNLFEKYEVPYEFDLLSIDIDYNDYWVWRAIKDFSPRVVVIEYNASLPPLESRTVPYEPDYSGDGTDYFGASLAALEKLGREKGYVLIACESAGANAFFIRRDVLKDAFAIKPLEVVYRPPAYGEKINGVYRGHRRSGKEMIPV